MEATHCCTAEGGLTNVSDLVQTRDLGAAHNAMMSQRWFCRGAQDGCGSQYVYVR